MSNALEGKACIITGAGSGIGRATALAMAAQGAHVVIADVRRDELKATAELVGQHGAVVRTFPADVREEDEIAGLVSFAIKEFGKLDCAVNNAGIEGDTNKPLADYETSVWSDVIAINLTGVFFCMKLELPHLVASKGCIVNTASVAGLCGSRFGSAYHASKHGVVGLTRAAAVEYGDKGVRINAVAPGVIRTSMADRFLHGGEHAAQVTAKYPLGRLGQPEEVAQAIVWLCSASASFITGHVLPVDGGFLVP